MDSKNYCKGCYYSLCTEGMYTCNYILIEKKRRGCPPGEKCSKRLEKQREKTTLNYKQYTYD